MKGLPLSVLPATIRDAIRLARDLGLRFIWIDAFCILQDCELDKNAELRKMQDIYHNAYVTIIAASAKECSDGFLCKRSATESQPFSLPFLFPDDMLGNVMLEELWHYEPSEEPVEGRAWTLQERLLSLES